MAHFICVFLPHHNYAIKNSLRTRYIHMCVCAQARSTHCSSMYRHRHFIVKSNLYNTAVCHIQGIFIMNTFHLAISQE